MSASTAYSCCCGGGSPWPPEYYVFTPCEAYPCCDFECAGGVDIKWCPSYASAQGLITPVVLFPGKCIKIKVGCCVYVMTAVVPNPSGVCPTGVGPWNIGTYIGTTIIDPAAAGCCDFPVIEPPDNCLTQAAYIDPLVGNACYAYVFEPYNLADQWGIVPSKPVTVQSTMTYCYASFGRNWDQPCDGCEPIEHFNAKVFHPQQIGSCIPTDALSSCLGQRTYEQTVFLKCAECNPCGECCDIDPCEGVDPNLDYCEDPSQTFAVRTCYAVNPCLDAADEQEWFEEDVLTVTYDFCSTVVDPDDPDALDQLEAIFQGGSPVTPWSAGTVWAGGDTGIRLALCPGGLFGDPSVFVFSGNAKHIASAINALSTNFPWLSATFDPAWAECFWFGVRQTCDNCPGDPPGTRPVYGAGGQDADELAFDRCEIVNANKFRAIFKGRSRKLYVCAAQTVLSDYSIAANCLASSTDVINLAVSATGDAENGYERQCLSPAEYACGERYSMRQVEQIACSTTICTPSNPTLTVIGCDTVEGYPETDIIVGGVVVVPGWQSLCGGGLGSMPPESQIKCRSYPFQYAVPACGTTPYTGECSTGVWQSAAVYCETSASVIQVL